MPRPNQPRSIASEEGLARRIAYERENRGMSYEGLASRMTKAGCPIQASAIYKIEKSDPPRRITVDELVAFSQVFAVPVEELLLPAEVVTSKELSELIIKWNSARERAAAAKEEESEAWDTLRAYVSEHPELGDQVESLMKIWVDYHFAEHDHEGALAYWMQTLTESPEWRERFADFVTGKA